MEGPRGAPQSYLDLGLEDIFRVMPAVPEEMRPGPNPHGAPWELVMCAAMGVVTVLLFFWRSVQSVRGRLYLKREKKLALKLSEQIEEKCKLLDKVSLLEKVQRGLEASLKDANSEKESKEAQIWEALNEMLNRCVSNVGDKILFLEKEVKEEKSKWSQQDELMAETSERIKSLEDESKSLTSQIAEAKTTLRVFQMSEEELKVAIKEALSENSQLQASQKDLLQEAEVWKDKVSDLKKEKMISEHSKVRVEQVLSDQENHMKSLTERFLKMSDWAPVLGEDLRDDGHLELERKSETEIGAHLDDQRKGIPLKELVHAIKLSASLEILEEERKKMCTLVSEVGERNKELVEHIENLQTEQASLKSENTHFEQENQQLQQKFKAMMEEYQENELKLHRKVIVEGKCLLAEEKRLSEVEEKIRHAAEQLETCKKQAQGLEEELERTDPFYQRQIISCEKEAHDNAFAAWAADRNLKYLRQVNACKRQKLAELEFKFKLLEEDLYAFGVSTQDDCDNSNVPDSSLPTENHATGGGFVFSPLAPIRGSFLPVDPGSQFMRGGPFFPPPPPRNMYGEIRGPLFPMDPSSQFMRGGPFLPPSPPRNTYGKSRDDFLPGPPPPPFPMQNVHSLSRFPDYLP